MEEKIKVKTSISESRKLEVGAHRAADLRAAIVLDSCSGGTDIASLFSVNKELSVCLWGSRLFSFEKVN